MNKATLIVFALLVLIPASPLLLTWRRVLSRGDSLASVPGLTVKLPLFVTTASCLLFFLGLFFKSAIGADYSDRRFITIWTNLGLAVLMVALSLLGKNPLRVLVAIAAGAVALVWLYAWAVSAAV